MTENASWKTVRQSYDDLSRTLLDRLLDEQGFIPTPLESLEVHRQREQARLNGWISNFGRDLLAGLQLIAERDAGPGAVIARGLLQNMTAPDTLRRYLEQHVINNGETFQALLNAVTDLHNRGDLHAARTAISVLTALYTTEPQPYVLLGTIAWQLEGLEAAAQYYGIIVQALQHPLIDYFAADCLHQASQAAQAKDLRKRALAMCDEAPEQYREIRPEIETFLAEL